MGHMLNKIRLKSTVLVMITVALASCTALPRSGPSDTAIRSKATVEMKASTDEPAFEYVLVDMSRKVVGEFNQTIFKSLRGFGGGKGPAPQLALGIGDVVSLSIFESQAGGLFIPQDAGSRPGNYVTLPRQTVDQSGMISVPYAGAVRAAGRPVGEVQTEIEKLLANRAIEPQVVITTEVSRSNTVSILGDVNSPAQLDLSPAGERVLDVISRAGGLNAPGYETYVTIQRAGREATVLFRVIVDDPRENIYVRPGDTIFVSRERRTYLALGATGLSGRFDFEDSNLTLGEAIGKAGGLLDGRADPSQVFLYRKVDRRTLQKLGINVSRFASEDVPTIFRIDLRDPAMLFATQEFRMKDKDTIYISNAGSVELAKVLNLINGVSDTSANVPQNMVTTRNSARRLNNGN